MFNFDISFLVVTYNQFDYIEKSLNSILFQKLNFFSDKSVQLVIADDNSNDGTKDAICNWISINKGSFSEVNYIRNDSNKGVCDNICNGIRKLKGTKVKMVAGDDMLPRTSIKPLFDELDKADIVSGVPLYFNANKDEQEFMERQYDREMLHMIARMNVGKNKSFKNRIDRHSYIHAPSVVYRTRTIQNEKILSFIQKFKYMEDYSMFYKIGNINPNTLFSFVPCIGVLYRRTEGSIIINHYRELLNDKKSLAKIILHDKNSSITNKAVKMEEIIAFSIPSRWIHDYAIPDYWIRKIGVYVNLRMAQKLVKQMQNDININREYISSQY